MNHQFQTKSKFALVTASSIYVNLPESAFRLSDGTWVMPGVPVPDRGTWKEWLGSIRMEHLERANLVLFVEEASDNPEILDAAHHRLEDHIRRMSELPAFFHSKGYRRAPITNEWLEDALALRAGLMSMEADKAKFRRVIRGLNTLFSGLKATGQARLHQFVRSLEALILPEPGRTRRQFAHRCQTFTRAGNDTQSLLGEAFDLRSDTEHLHEWDRAVQVYPAEQREDVCLQRTRQIEQLAGNAYSRLLRDATVREHFQTETTIAAFWKQSDDKRQVLWGKPLDIALEPLVNKYDGWDRATP